MRLVQIAPNISSSFCFLQDPRNLLISLPINSSSLRDAFSLRRKKRNFVIQSRGRLKNDSTHSQTSSSSSSSSSLNNNNAQIRTGVEIPVTCYQIVGVSNQAEKDEIVKSVMSLRNAEVEEGYTLDAVVSRQDLLMDVRDKLLFEPEYAGNVREKLPPKSSLRIPWSWVPAALCLLQEAGEENLVLEIGRAALQHPDANPYTHDCLLSMALAECAIAKTWFEKNKVSQGFEALARAQYLLKTKESLGNMPLLSEIEESLERLAPACTLELLDMPHTPEYAERRRGAIAALRELLGQGLDVETTCQVRDWPCFLSQALSKLMATEIIELLPWDNIAIARKNKKSLESQNQRVVIDSNCFYKAMIAHIAVGFLNKQPNLIDKARTICECLVASEGVDLKFEDSLCSFLLGQGAETEAIERLRELQIDSGPASRYFMSTNLEKNASNDSVVNPSLEIWLKDAVLGLFSDTRDCSPALESFFKGERRSLGHTKRGMTIPKPSPGVNRKPSFAVTPNRVGSEEPHPHLNSARHIGVAVKQLTPGSMQCPLATVKTNNGTSPQPGQLERKFGTRHKNYWESWTISGSTVQKITFVTIAGCFAFIVFKLLGVQIGQMRSLSRLHTIKSKTDSNRHVWTRDPYSDYSVGPARIGGNNIARSFRNLLNTLNKKLEHLPDDRSKQSSVHVDDVLLFTNAPQKREMPMEEAEALVKQWQEVKAEALGPEHQVHILPEVLAEPMLVEWQALADSAKAKACFWRFVLLQLSVLRADILYNGNGSEMAEIEALLEEAAELVDDSQAKNPNYYSTYKIRYVLERQHDGSWRFCQWGIQAPR